LKYQINDLQINGFKDLRFTNETTHAPSPIPCLFTVSLSNPHMEPKRLEFLTNFLNYTKFIMKSQMFQTEVQPRSGYEKILRSQFVTLNEGRGGRRYNPMVFTEQGILMLSSVLKSERAIQVNIQIVRTFIKLREMLSNHKEVKEKIELMEKKYDQRFKVVFDTLKQLLVEPAFA